MKMLSKSIVFFVGMLFVGISANAQDEGRLLHSGTYGVTSLFEFMGSSSWLNIGNYNVNVYENTIVFINEKGGIGFKFLYKGQSSDGGRLYRQWDLLEGRECDGFIVYNNGTFYRTDGKMKFEKGGSAPAPSQQYNGYNNSGNSGNNNYQNNNNSGQKTCYHCNGSGKCPSCAGRGEKRNQYNGSMYDCYECHGNGRCTTCSGRGWVVNYY